MRQFWRRTILFSIAAAAAPWRCLEGAYEDLTSPCGRQARSEGVETTTPKSKGVVPSELIRKSIQLAQKYGMFLA